MESGNQVINTGLMLFGIFVGAIILVLSYSFKLFNNDEKVEEHQKNDKVSHHSERKKEVSSSKTKKKVSEKWNNRADKQGFTHPWLIKSLKGHTGEILDVDFSSNNKYLISCADEDPGGHTESSGSSSDSTKDISDPPSTETSPKSKGLSRRQRKNRRKEDISPETRRKAKKKSFNLKRAVSTPLKIWTKLEMDEHQLYRALLKHILPADKMREMAYPVLVSDKNGHVIIHKNKFPVFEKRTSQRKNVLNDDYDSGQGSGNSSDSSESLDEPEKVFHHNDMRPQFYVSQVRGRFDIQIPVFKYPYSQLPIISAVKVHPKVSLIHNSHGASLLHCYISPAYIHQTSLSVTEKHSSTSVTETHSSTSVTETHSSTSISETHSSTAVAHPYVIRQKRTCVRCSSSFLTTDREYISQESCKYHWGKLNFVYNKGTKYYTCCEKPQGSKGCLEAKLHVWNGLEEGQNYFTDYVRTKHRKFQPVDGNYGIFAIDCEMSYTVRGLELTKVTVIGPDGRLVYDSFVKPENEIIDYNTRFSGITSKDMKYAKSLREVQNDLMGFINADTIIIGHALENDLRALKIAHLKVVDTSFSFPHYSGLPYRRSLKNLAHSELKREIQDGRHNSYEDALAALELILTLIYKENFLYYLMFPGM